MTASRSNAERASRPGVAFVTYNGLLDPLGASQMLPYLERLNADWPVRILSFERADKLADASRLAALERRMRDQQIAWTHHRYHKRPSLPATTYDMLHGVVTLRRWIREHRLGLIHARGYVPMEIASNATLGTKVATLFDIRGLQAEEYVDGGVWREGELKWRLAKRSERRFFRRASGAVVLTEAIRPYVEGCFTAVRDGVPPLEVVPCCVDLERFRFDASARAELRRELGVADDTVVFVYSGSLGTWYMPDAMARLVKRFGDRTGRRTFLYWLVNNDAEIARTASVRAGLRPDEIAVRSVPSDQVPAHLAAGDVGLAMIKPCFSKRSSSPTKYAEYLAVGLPIVISRDVGDGARLEAAGGAAALGEEVDDEALDDAVDRLLSLLPAARSHFRALAESEFDVDAVALPRYRRLYGALMESSA
jgi:glycosyltransferase involved in cell wall biosynthesis